MSAQTPSSVDSADAANPGELPADIRSRVGELIAQFCHTEQSVAELLCDGHPPTATAFVAVDGDLTPVSLTYGELGERSRKMAALLADRGVGAGDRVAVLMSRGPDLIATLLAVWRLGAVHVPLFTAFAAPAVETRVRSASARVVVTQPDQQSKLSALTECTTVQWDSELSAELERITPSEASYCYGPDEIFIQLYTSGTTGTPKGVPVPRRALAAFVAYLEFGLDVTEDDVFWNAADPGWAYGLYYSVIAPMAAGRLAVLAAIPFSAESCAAVLQACKVTNFAGAPTMYRAMANSGVKPPKLRRASSAGEPLTPDVNRWAPAALGTEVRDHYGQTEQGMVIANCWHEGLRRPLEMGSMGRSLPGFAADVRDGMLVLDTHNSPLMWFTGYIEAPERTAERFSPDGRWYLTGDAAVCRGDHFAFVGRDDDVILMAGYRISPCDIEDILIADPDVIEAAVVARPDSIRGEVIKAFVVVRPEVAGEHGDPEASGLTGRLVERVRMNYGRHAFPREVEVIADLPRTPSGKLQRFVLRQRSK